MICAVYKYTFVHSFVRSLSENVEHFAALISRVEALSQSRSKSSFVRIGRDAMIG